MKQINILLLFLLFQFSGFAQRIIREECVGTASEESIVKTHENEDSTLTILYIKQGYSFDSITAGYKIALIKLDKNKDILLQKDISPIYNISDAQDYYFHSDGSFLTLDNSFNIIEYGILIANKYDKDGNLLWQTPNLSPAITSGIYTSNTHKIIETADNGYIISDNISNSEYHKLICLSANGQTKWSKEISTADMLPVNSLSSSASIYIIPKRDNKTFISYITLRYEVYSIAESFAYNMILDSTGNTIIDDTIDASGGILAFGFSYDAHGDLYIMAGTDSASVILNTNDLSRQTSIDTSLGICINPIALSTNSSVDASITNFFFQKSTDIGLHRTIICTDSNSHLLWSYSFLDSTLSFPLYASIIDDSTIFIHNTLIRNGREIWKISLHNNEDTILHNGNYYHYTGYSDVDNVNALNGSSVSKHDHHNINIFSTYTYDYCPAFCDFVELYRFQTVDINTGNITQDFLIDRNIGYINYIKSIGKNEVFVASTNYNTCHIGGGDIYFATFSQQNNYIKGIAYIDYNNNNTKETNEPFYAYGYANTISVRDTQSQHLSINYPFSFFTDTGTYTTALHLYNDYYNITPPEFNTSHNTYGNSDTVLFALQPKPDKNDVSIQLVNNWHTRLGLNNSYTVSVENKGTTIANGKVKVLMDSRLLNVTTTPNYSYRIGDTLVWNIGNLAPLQTGMATINFAASVPSVLNAGDTIISKAWYESDSVDLTPADNYAEVKETVRASYDPNEKAITSGETLTPQQISNGSYISYIIHFQNKGNDTAFKVIILDTLSENLDVNSLQIINASASYTLEIIHKKILKFTFENIRLPYDTTSISSTGYIAYKVKPLNTLAAGNTINNTAEIFFDFNPPIKTNTVQTKILLVSAVHQNKGLEGKMTIFPNPNTGVFTVSFENKGNSTIQLQLTDITGALIFNESRQHQNKTAFTIDESNLAKGIYWIKLSDGNDVYSSAVIVQ